MVKADGDVKAITRRLEKEGKIRIEELPTVGATYLWTGGPVQVVAARGVTPAPGPTADPVTPEESAAGVTEASPGPRRGVTPKARGRKLRAERTEKVATVTAPENVSLLRTESGREVLCLGRRRRAGGAALPGDRDLRDGFSCEKIGPLLGIFPSQAHRLRASPKARPRKMPQDRRSPFPGAERYGFYGRV